MRMTLFIVVLLILSATTIATVSIASDFSLPSVTSKVQGVMLDADSGRVGPNSGDPVGGGGGGPG